MSKHMEFYIQDDAASIQIGKNVYKRVLIPIDDFNAACDHYGFVKERTCRNNAPVYLDFLCSGCGFVHYHSEANDTGEGNEWNYCPSCGAKVTPKCSETTPKVVGE